MLINESQTGKTRMKLSSGRMFLLLASASALAQPAWAQEDEAAELAKKLSNPVASLISVPLQYNHDEYGGANDGATASKLIAQPVVPFALNEDWNLITRTLITFVDQKDFPVAAANESGISDITTSLFFSPKSPSANGLIWGVGPVLLLPTASQEVLGTEKWGVGPTGVALKQTGPWTVGMLVGHIWSVAGNDERHDVNTSTLQPFFSYTTASHTTIGAYTESAYDWKGKQWQVPLIVQAGQMLKIGPQILQLAVAAKYWADAPDNGPTGWGLRAQLTFLFPK
ncbi:transporter [Niveibacterium sp. 24ML]|uniref:transporter n=1 Tax=Niveibacterium sp. 24ML TaxID=2985512 RepID=UPI00226E0FEA|nr:transporter [Niveibacterium sp. 24ML]MCX9155584.1 transporter [Niveibacterium sp. 24ML]